MKSKGMPVYGDYHDHYCKYGDVIVLKNRYAAYNDTPPDLHRNDK